MSLETLKELSLETARSEGGMNKKRVRLRDPRIYIIQAQEDYIETGTQPVWSQCINLMFSSFENTNELSEES